MRFGSDCEGGGFPTSSSGGVGLCDLRSCVTDCCTPTVRVTGCWLADFWGKSVLVRVSAAAGVRCTVAGVFGSVSLCSTAAEVLSAIVGV